VIALAWRGRLARARNQRAHVTFAKISRKISRDVRESESALDHASAALSSSGKMRCIAGLRHAAGCTIEPAQTSPSVVVIDIPFGIASPDADDAVTDQLEEIFQSLFFS
jgi:hypothetical protein